MYYAEPFPAAVLDRLKRIRTVAVELDRDELVMKATRREGFTTPEDWRELCRWDPLLPPDSQPPMSPNQAPPSLRDARKRRISPSTAGMRRTAPNNMSR